MAAHSSVLSLQDELSCSICLEYFQDPVSIHCGHNFCRACISQCWEETDTNFSCPQCRETAQQKLFRPNRELGKVVEITRQLSFQVTVTPGGEQGCETHREALKLFCETDQQLICVICRESQAHRAHSVFPVEEAAQQYKKQFQTRLQTLKEEREKLLGLKVSAEGRSREYLEKTDAQRQKIVSEFEQLRQFLEEQERLLLGQLAELEKGMTRMQEENFTKLCEEISRLSELIREMEGKCRQPVSEFLQDVRNTLTSLSPRCEKGQFQQPLEISPELEKRLCDFCPKIFVLKETLKKLKDTLPSELEREWANVTLDPDTAHPELVLSEDRKGVKRGHTRQHLPYNLERFDAELCVLGCVGFTSGRHCWEVEVGDEGGWAVGVARESVRRKGEFIFQPEKGIWAVGLWRTRYLVLTSPATPLSLSWVPRRIRVSLDYTQGQVAFFDADSEAPIFTFPPASFMGERVRPWLWVEMGSQLRLCP
ncbi:zinc finger protein RFP-like isoform X1 [Mauremys mutica]|uniref:zinc finger protein RFP-like isoform X1 n=1 Tax=Mauremys mutica TaxID=74926 RepID=UPI001D15F3A3|nr:zinc finger protein RFP-like isoform X1 [Mauremys mutica]XP_044838095.1 zinc finger protein RFP-like isoform X1 [Mauremys mutica]